MCVLAYSFGDSFPARTKDIRLGFVLGGGTGGRVMASPTSHLGAYSSGPFSN